MKKYSIAILLLGLIATSCNEKLNITPPNAITNEQVLELLETADDETVVSIMGAMADGLNSEFKHTSSINGWSNDYWAYAQSLDVQRGFSGNDMVLDNLPPTGADLEMYNFVSLRTADNVNNEPFWRRGYYLVHAANKVFNLLTDELVEQNGSSKLKEYQARAYLTRAYGYLYLMENYGTDELGVPIYTVYSLDQSTVARSTAEATFDSIVKWAGRAVSLFEEAGVGYDHNTKGDLNAGIANYVLARAALWKKDWATVVTACDKLIDNYALMSEDQYVGRNAANAGEPCVYYAAGRGFTDLSANPECILGWDNANKERSSADYWLNFMASGKQARIDDRLYNKIADEDYRKDNFQVSAFGKFIAPSASSFADDGSEYDIGTYINLKFAANVGIGGSVGNSTTCKYGTIDYCLFRVSEAYLMKAEAQAQQGQDGEAKNTLNTLIAARTNGALTCDTYPSMSGMSALDMVKLQTRIEMWGEHSLEFYNNRRWKIDVDRSGSTVHHTANTIPYAQLVLQIPEQELNTNNLIVQNP